MTKDKPEAYVKSQFHALNYMRDFADKIKGCRDVTEYYELVTGVLVFSNLVRMQFKQLYEMDAESAIRELAELGAISEIIAEDVVKSAESLKSCLDFDDKKDMN